MHGDKDGGSYGVDCVSVRVFMISASVRVEARRDRDIFSFASCSLHAHLKPSFWHSQVAGIKAAGAKVWGPLMNVVTPQKLFLFVLFQVKHLTRKFESPTEEKPKTVEFPGPCFAGSTVLLV